MSACADVSAWGARLATIVKAGYRAILANGPAGEWYLNGAHVFDLAYVFLDDVLVLFTH